MGWASGSELAQDMWDELKQYIPKKDQVAASRVILEAFEDRDADDWDIDSDLIKTAAPEWANEECE